MRKARFQDNKKHFGVDRPLDPPRKAIAGHIFIKVSDRVSTAHGAGTVVQIAGDRYLIALDSQIGRLWERLSSLKLLTI